jgi:hypothetical protein
LTSLTVVEYLGTVPAFLVIMFLVFSG